MERTLKNALSVLLLTAFTALAILGTVQVTGRIVGASAGTALASSTSADAASTATDQSAASAGRAQAAGAASSSSDLLTCPRTGCSAASCHAAR